MQISAENFKLRKQAFSALQYHRLPFWNLWRELADFYLPKRYVWLQSDTERRVRNAKNPHILDGTGTAAARVLAAGMLNGITSPSRPWFSLRIPGFSDDPDSEARLWVDEVTRRMLTIMSETNLYNALATMYLDLVVFGSAACLIYEDTEKVFRCYSPALGEYYFGQDFRGLVNTFGREISMTVAQIVGQFGKENCSHSVREAFEAGGARLQDNHKVSHLIEENVDGKSKIAKKFRFRETYWESGANEDKVLAERGFNEMPGIFPRWELTANDAYGTSPAMDALPDVIQLQHETKKKAQGLDKMVSPPVIADIQLKHSPTSLVPNGITYIAGNNNMGVRPAYQVQIPLQELAMDIQDVRTRVRETFHNPLFNMISQLDTVRSATEIDARREEKLVLLGSVLERFENEALDPLINRVFQIMLRQGLLPEPPEEIGDAPIEIQYVSILSTAQKAIGAAPVERWVGLVGNLAAVAPQVLKVPNWEELVRNYGEAIGVAARDMNSRATVDAMNEEERAQQEAQEAQVMGANLVDGAKQLSETDVGGGANALQAMLG